jgi:hypothetical protein
MNACNIEYRAAGSNPKAFAEQMEEESEEEEGYNFHKEMRSLSVEGMLFYCED